MAAVCLYVSNPFSRSRLQVNNIDLQGTVAGFKGAITETVGIQANKQELIYMGSCLTEEERSLHSYGVESDVTIFVLEKLNWVSEKGREESSEASVMTVEELQALLNKARNPLYKQSVKKFIKSAAMRTSVNAAVLSKDPVTASLLADPDLLLVVIETASAENIVQHYPALCVLLNTILTNAAIDSTSVRQHLYHDDDEESEFMGIDPAFLAQAELLASNEESLQQASSSTSSTSTLQQQQQRHRISATDLANALSFASMAPTGSTGTPTVSSTPTEDQQQTEVALEQMRAMGITDDQLSRRALSMSGGVVEAALNLIFEGTLV